MRTECKQATFEFHAGLTACFRDHRDARLIEHTVEELLGQRIYGLWDMRI